MAAFIAQAVKLNNVVGDFEIVFLAQTFFCFSQQLDLFIDEIRVIDDLVAIGTDQVMMVVRSFGPFSQLVTRPSIAEIKLGNHAEAGQDIQRPVHRCQPDIRMPGVDLYIDIFGTKMAQRFR
jgi:hypothetical protein